MNKELQNKLRQQISKFLPRFMQDEENLKELFETVVQNWVYNNRRETVATPKELEDIYSLSQELLQED